ncbi:MAG: valine--tRNA ligase [Candidatus Midichloria sp.]|nr:MAG: valine--tRNA ligase [Candidatus Midichloria sp.]
MFEKRYNHKTIEKKWQDYWYSNAIYNWNQNIDRKNTFIIDTPPPTVSGFLHMGHMYSYAQADFVARFQRMSGKNVFFPIGFDDNGLPTERLVEKEHDLRAAKIDKIDLNKISQEVVKKYEKEFRNLFKSTAFSFDWSQEYQTISNRTRKLSQMSFIDLYRKNLLYRRHAPTFWDPVDQTAIAQAEIEDKEQAGIMSEIQFQTPGGHKLVIATTRPELLPACAAILYHQADPRYKNLKNKQAIVPIFGHQVPIISDEDVEQDKGTGLVMCCTFGNIQDIHWWQKYNLELKECINKFGRMQNAGKLNGLKIKIAREKILDILKEMKLILGQNEVLRAVKCAERSGAPLEIIPTSQWYISIVNKKGVLLDQANKCKWHPEYMKLRLENWIKGLNQDWCISRQRYFGVPFPIWYSRRPGEEGKILLADISQLPVDPLRDLPSGYKADEVTPELDIMDTWATSSLTPQLSSWGISNEIAIDYDRHEKLFPADLRPQAHEIIRTWAFTTIVKSLYHQNTIPWHNIMISGWCMAADKSKMSKSKGNVVTPQKLIEEKSADTVRYWAANSKLGSDIVYSEEAFKLGHRLINKIWNIAKFCSIHLPKLVESSISIKGSIETRTINQSLDFWILTKLKKVIKLATKHFENFEYWDAKNVIEEFFWKDYCNNYIELAKHRLYNDNKISEQQSGVATIKHSLSAILKLFAPFIPHLTEEIYQTLFPHELVSIHQQGSWPKFDNLNINENHILIGNTTVALLDLVRKSKSLLNISVAKEVELIEIVTNLSNIDLLTDFKNAVNAKQIKLVNELPEEALRSECGYHAVKLHLK